MGFDAITAERRLLESASTSLCWCDLVKVFKRAMRDLPISDVHFWVLGANTYPSQDDDAGIAAMRALQHGPKPWWEMVAPFGLIRMKYTPGPFREFSPCHSTDKDQRKPPRLECLFPQVEARIRCSVYMDPEGC